MADALAVSLEDVIDKHKQEKKAAPKKSTAAGGGKLQRKKQPADAGAKPKAKAAGKGAKAGTKTVFFGGLPDGTTWQQLKVFAGMGGSLKVEHADIEESRGGHPFGLVKYATYEDAEAAIADLHGAEFDGRTVTVKADKESKTEGGKGAASSSTAGGASGKSRDVIVKKPGAAGGAGGAEFTVKVSNLPFDLTSDELSGIFRGIGGLKSAKVWLTKPGAARNAGWGLVTFSNGGGASRAVREFNGASVNGREISVALDNRD